MTYKTPGVYVEEISIFPPSVAEVETAIPAFIGYTQKAESKGESLTNKPTKISSLLEYRELFGGPYEIEAITVKVNPANNHAVDSLSISKRFYMFECLRLFFDNGGGECYIVSVGGYDKTIQNGDPSDSASHGFKVGLKALSKYDEPTIILFPDAALLGTESHLYALQQDALAQCADLQDRVAVLDLFEAARPHDVDASVEKFRNGIGINDLKYGAACTPWIISSYERTVDFSVFRGSVEDTGGTTLPLANLTTDSDLNALVSAAETALDDKKTIADDLDALEGTSKTLKDAYKSLRDAAVDQGTFQALLAFVRGVVVDGTNGVVGWKDSLEGANLQNDLATYVNSTLASAATSLIALEKNDDVIAISAVADVDASYQALTDTGWLDATTVGKSATDYDDGGALSQADTIKAILPDLDDVFQEADKSIVGFIGQMESAAATHAGLAQTTLYQEHTIIGNIVQHIKKELGRVPPSGAVAGVYARVDDARGVWKAPANVSLSSVLGPVEPIDDAEQEDLNVDVNAGKSINAIRPFTGRGTLVWGARTLAGNDNEWRYVPVRRFFNMVEESVKKSTAWAVFEPNAAPLWTKVKSMIDNYLIQKWREGALAGATPDEAFFVKVGLGETMTAVDILEGRLNVEIGMAVVRPAEFIILKFSHKMQES